MSALSNLIDALPPSQRTSTYDDLAQVALRSFAVNANEVVFLGHNSEVAFRIETPREERLLLKVHAPQGEGESPEPAAILAVGAVVAARRAAGARFVRLPVTRRGFDVQKRVSEGRSSWSRCSDPISTLAAAAVAS